MSAQQLKCILESWQAPSDSFELLRMKVWERECPLSKNIHSSKGSRHCPARIPFSGNRQKQMGNTSSMFQDQKFKLKDF